MKFLLLGMLLVLILLLAHVQAGKTVLSEFFAVV